MDIVEYDEIRAKMDEVKEICNFLPDVTTDEGYQKSKRVSLDVGKLLTSLEKSRKALKADSLAFGRKVDSDAKDLVAELEGYQEPHKAAYKELDNLKKEREQQRKAELEQRIADMRELPELMRDADSGSVKAALEGLNSEECLDFYEYTEQALKARNAARDALAAIFGQKLKQEQEAAELDKLRKEQAERNQKDREDRIAQEAADNAKREAEQAAEKARLQAEASANAEHQRIEQEKAQAEAAEKAAIQEKQDAERKLKEQAEAAELEKEAAIERERQRIADEKAQADAETAKREADRKHKGKINRAAVAALVEFGGMSERQAKMAITAIAKKQIPNVTITY